MYCLTVVCYHYVSSIEREFWYALRPTDILTVILVAMDVFETYLAIDVTMGPSNWIRLTFSTPCQKERVIVSLMFYGHEDEHT